MKINWRFFSKEVSPTEFRTRFPSAKSIEELAHFGNLFMRTVPGAIISMEKWSGDIEPISLIQEAWFRIKGIPMNFRSKSTALYAASLVGKPLDVDKNFIRNFSYVRVRIGCQDLSLVPNTRIGEMRGGFYELQYTRELFKNVPTPGTKITVANTNQEEEGVNGTTKRQRTARNDSDAGSQSAPPKVTGNGNKNTSNHWQAAVVVQVAPCRDILKRKLFETDLLDDMVDTGIEVPRNVAPSVATTHKPVADSPAPISMSSGQASSSASVAPSYTQFLHTLVKYGSGKTFMFRKEYRKELGPIIEENNEENLSEEKCTMIVLNLKVEPLLRYLSSGLAKEFLL
jgi:hypothetical protein